MRAASTVVTLGIEEADWKDTFLAEMWACRKVVERVPWQAGKLVRGLVAELAVFSADGKGSGAVAW